MLCEKGFNEYDNNLFEHLLHNRKPCSYVRTMCDNQIGEEDDVSNTYFVLEIIHFQSLGFGYRAHCRRKAANVWRAHAKNTSIYGNKCSPGA